MIGSFRIGAIKENRAKVASLCTSQSPQGQCCTFPSEPSLHTHFYDIFADPIKTHKV